MESDLIQTNSGNNWLAPSEALTQFDPPEGLLLGDSPVAQDEVRYGFRAAGLAFLIPARQGSEVVPMPGIAAIPNAPRGLKGMFNLRGNLVPVFDLERALDLETAKQDNPMLLVVGKTEEAAGILVDGYPKPLTGLRPVQALPQLPTLLGRHVAQGYVDGTELWLELDQKGLLEELASI